MFDIIKIDELAVCVVEGETSNLACFSICVGFVGIILGPPDTNSTMCSPLSNSSVSSPKGGSYCPGRLTYITLSVS